MGHIRTEAQSAVSVSHGYCNQVLRNSLESFSEENVCGYFHELKIWEDFLNKA